MRRTNVPLKTFARTALVGGVLGLAACQGANTATIVLPPHQQKIADANKAASTSLSTLPDNTQLAQNLRTGTRTDAPSGILQPGTIILRRTSTVEKPMPPEKLAETIRRIASETAEATAAQTAEVTAARTATQAAASVAQNAAAHAARAVVESEKPLILAAADARLESVAVALENVRQKELAATEERLKSYTDNTASHTAAEAAAKLKAQAEQLNDLANQTELQIAALKDYTQQGTQIAELKATRSAEEAARQIATAVENRTRTLVVDESAHRQQVAAANLTAAQAQNAAELARAMAATTSQIQATQAQLSQLAAQTTQSLADVRAQQTLLAESGRDYARAEALAAQLQAQKDAIAQAQASVTQAEERSRDYARAEALAAQLQAQKDAIAQAQASVTQAEERSRDYARAEALAAQLEAQKTALQQARISAQQAEASAREYAAGQVALAETRRGFAERETSRQLAQLKANQVAQAELTRQATAAVAESLKSYADEQVTSLTAETARSIEAAARIGQMSTQKLADQTAFRLAQFRAEAANRAEQTAQSLASTFNQQLQQAQKETEEKALKPDQVMSLARLAVDDATPKLRAIALQSLADSQDYIRTIAQESLTDDADPKVQEALQSAAKNVITKDDQVVFAIRQALVTPVSATTQTAARTVLGNGHGLLPPPDVLGADVAIDPARLAVAPIGGFGVEPAAGEGAKTPTHLASLNPKHASMGNPRYKQDWLDLRKYRVVLHEDSRTLESLMTMLMAEAEPYVGPWTVKWKISRENQDILKERFSLDAETTFADFVTYISQYVLNERGVKLSFNLFDAERILVISD